MKTVTKLIGCGTLDFGTGYLRVIQWIQKGCGLKMPNPGYGENGSVVGPQNLPTNSVASGVWSLGEVAEAQRDEIWPNPPTGSYEFIAAVFVNNATTYTYTFTNIPQTYRFLDVRMMGGKNPNAHTFGLAKNAQTYNTNEAYMGTDSGWYWANQSAEFAFMQGQKASYAGAMGTVIMGNYSVSGPYLAMSVVGSTNNGNNAESSMNTTGINDRVNNAAMTYMRVDIAQSGQAIAEGSTVALFGIKDAN